MVMVTVYFFLFFFFGGWWCWGFEFFGSVLKERFTDWGAGGVRMQCRLRYVLIFWDLYCRLRVLKRASCLSWIGISERGCGEAGIDELVFELYIDIRVVWDPHQAYTFVFYLQNCLRRKLDGPLSSCFKVQNVSDVDIVVNLLRIWNFYFRNFNHCMFMMRQ